MKKLISIRVPDDILMDLKKHAAIDDRSLSSLIVRILREWLASNLWRLSVAPNRNHLPPIKSTMVSCLSRKNVMG